MKKKILVTGANGQLGSELRNLADKSMHTFVFTDIDTLDLSDFSSALLFLREELPDYIINCAAYTAVDKAEEETSKANLLNAGIPQMLADYGKETGCCIIHISTDYVFPGNTAVPLREIDRTGPFSAYGKSKLGGEEAIKSYQNSLIIRTSWLYSSYGNNFLKSMLRLMKERDSLGVIFDQVGTPTYAADLAAGILSIIGSGEDLPSAGIYHYSNEGVASWYDFAQEIASLTGTDCRILPITTDQYPLPAKRPEYAVLNKSKIKEEFGLSIPYWKDALQRCIKLLYI